MRWEVNLGAHHNTRPAWGGVRGACDAPQTLNSEP